MFLPLVQVQDAEERALKALEDKSGAKRLAELRKALLSKEHKMRALREALVKLKQVRRTREQLDLNTCRARTSPVVGDGWSLR